MPSISQAQAKFLKTGDITKFGIEQTDAPTLGTVEAMLALYAEEFIKAARQRLVDLGKDNSGDLGDSIKFEVTRFGASYKLELSVLDYYKFVDEGVRGRDPKYNTNNTSPYSYKYPAKISKPTHPEGILKWLKEGKGKSTVSDIKRYGTYGKTEERSLNRQQDATLANAKRIAYFIKRKGTKRTGFWTDPFKEVFADLEQRLGEALGVDISVDLKNLVQGIKKR